MEKMESEYIERVTQSLISGNKKACASVTQEAIDAGIDAQTILMQGLKTGMDQIGDNYANKVIYLPNVLSAATAMYAAIDVLKPHMKVDDGASVKGTVVIGTVEGDMHDIGKNIVRILLDGIAMNVIDLGRDVPLQSWINTVKTKKPDVVGCSTLMSTTLRSIEDVYAALSENNLRADVKIIIGGAATNATYAEKIGVDAWGKDASEGVKKIVNFCKERGK